MNKYKYSEEIASFPTYPPAHLTQLLLFNEIKFPIDLNLISTTFLISQ